MKRFVRNCGSDARRYCAFVLAVLMLAGIFCGTTASAAATKESTRMNVMLIIDGSASLDWEHDPTDPDGYRYDAIDLFLALLTDRDNNIGALVFHGSADDFQLNLGMEAINGKNAKLDLSDKIRSVSTDNGTNLGAALLQGVQEAADMSAKNGLESVVILFSDGKTEVSGGDEAMEASLRAKEEATVLAQNEDIPVYTVCLAATDRADPAELQEIATRTSGEFVKVEDAKALSKAFETFYQMIFGASGTEIQDITFPADGSIQVPFTIPTYGAEEVNVILDTNGLTNVAITTPNGDMSSAELGEATMSGGYYDVIKLVGPTPGDYIVSLQGVPESSVTVNVLFNVDSGASLKTSDNRNSYSTGEDVVFQANLIQNGAAVMDPAVTSEYTAVLTLTDLSTGVSQDYPMTPDNNGTFTYTLSSSSYSDYSACASLTCDDLTLSTNVWEIYFDNTPPEIVKPVDTVKKTVWLFFGRSHTVELSDHFNDAQDGKNLKYQLISSELVQDSLVLDENTGKLDVNTGKSKSGAVVVAAIDSKGASTQMTIDYDITDLTLIITGGTAALIVIGAVAAAIIIAKVTAKTWQGELEVRNISTSNRRTHGDFRGKLKLSSLGIGDCGVDGYFKAQPRNQVEFVAKKPVFTSNMGQGGKKIVSITGGSIKIYADASMKKGIEVVAKPRMVRSQFGGMGGGMGGGRGPAPGTKGRPSARKSGPF